MIVISKPKIEFINLLVLVFLVKELIFMAILPIWQTPDEQAHFAQVAYFAEFGRMPSEAPDLNKEIFLSEERLGTLRDINGNNKFTYHPEYKIEYSDNYIGGFEKEIKSYPISFRKELIKSEAAYYPPLYYWFAAIPYKLFYNLDLFSRVFLARFISVLISAGTILVAWLIGKEVFPKNKIAQDTLPTLVAFQPMFSFISAGVSSDNLLNLLFTLIIWMGILIYKQGINQKNIKSCATIFLLAYLTKPQFIIGVPIILISVVLYFIKERKIKTILKSPFLLTIFLASLLFLLLYINPLTKQFFKAIYPQDFDPGKGRFTISLISYSKEMLMRTLYETIPWYWGVFKWLGVVLPIEIIRALNRLLIIVTIGLVIKFVLMIRNRRIDFVFVYMFSVAIIYFLGILFYNYFFTDHIIFLLGYKVDTFFRRLFPTCI